MPETAAVVQSAWQDALSSIQMLADLIQTCQDAFTEDDAAPKVSATTKKRLTIRAMQGLQGGSELVQALKLNLKELQQASEQQQLEAQTVANSNHSLQQQLRGSSDECHSSKRALLQAEAQKAALQQQLQELQQQLQAATAEGHDLQEAVKELQGQVQGAAQQAVDARCHMQQLQEQMEQLAEVAREAEAGADAAAGALQAVQEQAAKERAARERHEDAVARLTADNLVFMAQLRAAQAGAAAAAAERDEFRLALEQHKGPWMDEVHQGVELRVKAAMARADELEAQLELARAQHTQHTQQLQLQQANLEAALQEAQQQAAEQRQQLMAAQASAADARSAAEEAAVLASTAQAAADERAAELRVAQDSLRSMREECNERWMSERAARAQLADAEGQLSAQEASVAKLKKQLQARADDLATQRAVNQQLMLKKEEVEWQLLAAIAQLQHTQVPTPGSISPETSLDQQQQQQAQHASAAAAGSVPPPPPLTVQPLAADAGDAEHLSSPFGASAHLPLSPVQLSPSVGVAPLANTTQQRPPAAAPAPAPAARAPAAPAAARPEVPGPAVIAAGGGLWQLPGGSSSALFGARVSSTGGGGMSTTPLGGGLGNPMPAATAAAVGAMLNGSKSNLHHAFSCPEGNMYSLLPLGFGLATLPSPEQLIAAAEAAALGSGSLQKTVTIGRAGSLTVPVTSDAHTAGGAAGAARSSSGGGGSGADAAASSSSSMPPGHHHHMGSSAVSHQQEPMSSSSNDGSSSEGAACSAGAAAAGGVIGAGLTFRPPPVQPILLGPTGGLMAPFSPLSPGSKGPRASVGRGAVFPECITASAVTDGEQAELGCFSFGAGLTDALQQQGHVLGPGFWYLQQQQQLRQPQPQPQPQQQHQQQQSQPQSQPHHRHGSSGSLSDGEHPIHHSSSVCGSSGSLHEHELHSSPHTQHPAGSTAGSKPATDDPTAAALSALAAAAAGGGGGGEAGDRANDGGCGGGARLRNSSSDSNHSAGSSGGSNGHLHGILITGTHSSRCRSPAAGVSPSGSMKSVRFSFEGLDHAHLVGEDVHQEEQQHDQKSSRRSRSGSRSHSHSRLSTSPSGRGASAGVRSGSEWLHHTLYEQLSHQGPAGGGSRARRSIDSRGGGSSSKQLQNWAVSSHPPAYGHRGGMQYMGRFAEERRLQQQRQLRKVEAAKEVAAMTAAAAAADSTRRAPVHPIFGAMQLPSAAAGAGAGGGSSSSNSKPAAGS